MTIMKPSSELRDTAAVKKSTQSELSQDNEKAGSEHDRKMTRKEPNSDEKVNEQNVNFSNSEKEKHVYNMSF